jgi:hypothetical protein
MRACGSVRNSALGAGLQIALKGDSSLLIGELDADVEVPRTMARSVGTAAQDIDEALRGHGRTECKPLLRWLRQLETINRAASPKRPGTYAET